MCLLEDTSDVVCGASIGQTRLIVAVKNHSGEKFIGICAEDPYIGCQHITLSLAGAFVLIEKLSRAVRTDLLG